MIKFSKNILNISLKLLLVLTMIYGCTEKFDINEATSLIDGDNVNLGDTLYIQQSPNWTGFNNPQDMIVGREPFIYVADTDNDRIVMLNIAGQIMGEVTIKKPTAIAQNNKLELLVIAEFDTTINSNNVAFSSVYLIDLYAVGHILSNAVPKRLTPRSSFDFSKPNRKYTGICAFSDNSAYISRVGPANTSSTDPDNSIRVLNRDGYKDFDRLAFIEPLGTGLISANGISSLTSVNENSYDIIMTFTGNNNFKVQWLQYISSGINEGKYSNNLDVSTDLMQIGKFSAPVGSTLDDAGNLYIADAQKDSVFKFNAFGDEMESFGGPDVMSSPHSVAHHDKTLYVLDTDNNRIIRFILSTEID